MKKNNYILYTVEPGDSISMIALKYYGDIRFVQKIMDYNNIDDKRKIYIGRKIKLPMGREIYDEQ